MAQQRLAPLRWIGLLTLMALGVALVSIFFARAFDSAQETVAFDELKAGDTVLHIAYRGGLCADGAEGKPCYSTRELKANGKWSDGGEALSPSRLLMLERVLKDFRQAEREGAIDPASDDCGDSIVDGQDIHLQGYYWDSSYELCQLPEPLQESWREIAEIAGVG